MNQVLQNTKQSKGNSFVNTEEFKDAVQMAAQSAFQEMLSKLNLNQQKTDDTSSFVKSLVHELRTMSGSDNGKIQIAPEIMIKRSEAKQKMDDLCKKIRAEDREKKDPPRYRVVGFTYIANRLYEPDPDKTMGWYGAPNAMLIPMNSKARAIYDLFKESIGLPHDPIPEEAQRVDQYGRVVFEKVEKELNKHCVLEDHDLLVDDSPPDMSFFKIEDMIPPCDLIVD